MITTFEDLESFYSDNPARRRSPEAGYGVHWRLDGWAGTWRVSCVRDTGEVYALHYNGHAPLMLLGAFPIDPEAGPQDVCCQGLDHFLEKWTAHCGPLDGLAWLVRKMAQASQDGTPKGSSHASSA